MYIDDGHHWRLIPRLSRFCASMLLLVIISAAAAPALGADAIQYFPEKKLWVINAGEATYAFGVNERNELQSLYWGAGIRAEDLPAAHSIAGWSSFDPSTSVTPQEYPGSGGAFYGEPALKATFPDGNREVILHYMAQKLANDFLEITLQDEGSALTVELRYRVYPDSGIVERSSRIENRTSEPVMLESAQSAAWTLLPGAHARLQYLTGEWAGEWQVQSEELPVGRRALESRRGSTSAEVNPWFAIGQAGATEEQGQVWFGALGWSGSWQMTVERSARSQVRVTGGINPFDFSYALAPGESLETPPFYAGFTAGGMGQASRLLHRFELADIIPGGLNARVRPILYNGWEAQLPVNEAAQIGAAEKAARLGVERFVVDAGWFGSKDEDGVGDWYVNPRKFPHGLKPLIDRVHALGMDFGLWVEPESVSGKSELYREHPGWIMTYPNRRPINVDGSFVLNLARDDVKEWTFAWLDRLVSENDIALLKWDYNRNWIQPGWPQAPVSDQKKIWVRYVQNLYEILDRLRARHPGLEIETCSGGGGRVDLGILRRTDQAWPSDNTDALDRLSIQSGFAQVYTPHVMIDWVTNAPDWLHVRATPLKYRFLVAMTGALALGVDLNKLTPEDNALATKMIALYKEIRPTVQNGKLYRLRSPADANLSATEYVSDDGRQVVVFAFLHAQQFGRSIPRLSLRGLDTSAIYRLRTIDQAVQGIYTASGTDLMRRGLQLKLRGDYPSTLLILSRMSE
jgi:alpha-galactosidase